MLFLSGIFLKRYSTTCVALFEIFSSRFGDPAVVFVVKVSLNIFLKILMTQSDIPGLFGLRVNKFFISQFQAFTFQVERSDSVIEC